MNKNYNIRSYLTLEHCLFEAVKLTKNIDIDKCKYSGYVIGFDRKGTFSFGNRFCRNVIILGVDVSYSEHIDNKEEDILILGEGPTQELNYTKLTAEIFN